MATRPSVLSDPASLSALQARLKSREGTGAAAANGGQDISAAADGSFVARQSPSVVGNASQARSLRDRIYERTLSRSPLPPVMAGPAGYGQYQQQQQLQVASKDVYAHEQPFPVSTVFEVQRVNNPLPADERPQSAAVPAVKQSDTLLTDLESATLIRTLERKLIESAETLDAEKAKAAGLEGRVAELEAEAEGLKKTAEESTTRLTEAQAQCEAARQSIVAAVDTERAKFEEEFGKKEAELTASCEAQTKALSEELDTMKASVSIKDNDQSSLFVLVSELQKAVKEGAERQRKNADIIARLDKELQESRTRAATVSTGFHAKDKQVRDALGQVEALTNEVHALQHCREGLDKCRADFATLKAQFDEAQAELVPLRVTADEKARLQNHCQNMEQEIAAKNDELAKLRGQVDIVRQQADQAFARSSNFRGAVDASQRSANPATNYSQLPASTSGAAAPVGAGDASSYAPLPMNNSGAGGGGGAGGMADLQAAIRAADAQVAADNEAWKAKH